MGTISSKRKESSFEGEEVSFDHFQVLRAIGKGSFGKVCIVQKKDNKQMFAMKYMNKAQCEARDAVGNVFREIEILASLSHPFLVNLWFSFQDEEDMFMVVDLLLGGDLRYHVQQGVTFSDKSVQLFILEIGSALHYLHSKNIIHRDIKPDNLLLDEEGHLHLTDFNIATVVREGQLATSMSGTKPYMAPEVFQCALDACEGYDFAVDWWSLGVTAYEVRRGKRPFDIHSNTSLHDVRFMFLQPLKYPTDWHPGLVYLLSRMMVVSPESRLRSLEHLTSLPYMSSYNLEDVLHKNTLPAFVPPKDHLNCDPTFELEEMIIESRPLHKKKKRLSKQKSLRESHSSVSGTTDGEAVVYEGMLVFNREREEARRERERREQEWQAELERSMSESDPTGYGSHYTGGNTSCNLAGCQHREGTARDVSTGGGGNQSCGGGGGGGGGGGAGPPPRLEVDSLCVETLSLSHRSSTTTLSLPRSCATTPRSSFSATPSPSPSSPGDLMTLPKIAVSPSNVKARIAGSPKVKVRGATVTIQSPRSSSSISRHSAQQLKEKLRELRRENDQCTSGSESEGSDLTESDDLTITGHRSPGICRPPITRGIAFYASQNRLTPPNFQVPMLQQQTISGGTNPPLMSHMAVANHDNTTKPASPPRKSQSHPQVNNSSSSKCCAREKRISAPEPFLKESHREKPAASNNSDVVPPAEPKSLEKVQQDHKNRNMTRVHARSHQTQPQNHIPNHLLPSENESPKRSSKSSRSSGSKENSKGHSPKPVRDRSKSDVSASRPCGCQEQLISKKAVTPASSKEQGRHRDELRKSHSEGYDRHSRGPDYIQCENSQAQKSERIEEMLVQDASHSHRKSGRKNLYKDKRRDGEKRNREIRREASSEKKGMHLSTTTAANLCRKSEGERLRNGVAPVPSVMSSLSSTT